MSPLDRILQFKLRLGRVYRLDVYAHWSLLLVALYVFYEFRSDLKLGVLVQLALWGSVFLHELGHCWGARRVGGTAHEVILWPLGGLAMINAPMRPWPQFFSTLTGPLVNVIILAIALPIFIAMGGSLGVFLPNAPVALPTLGLVFLYYLVFLNGVLALFNIIPAFPLDGGRMLQAALWPRLGFHKAMTIAIYLAFVSAGLIMAAAIFIYSSVLLFFIGAFIISGSLRERARLRFGVYDEELAMGGSPWASSLQSFHVEDEPKPSAFQRWRERRKQRREEEDARRLAELRERLDVVLAKVSKVGMNGLSGEEKAFLEQASKELRKQQSG